MRYLENGQNRLISLETLFQEAVLIHNLDCPTHERISLMRLLVCITQAELGAPATDEDWDGFGEDMESRIPAYLQSNEILPHFNLFGDGPRFLQDASLERIEKNEAHSSWIVFHLASNNNYTLFDHEGVTKREIKTDVLARSIIEDGDGRMAMGSVHAF